MSRLLMSSRFVTYMKQAKEYENRGRKCVEQKRYKEASRMFLYASNRYYHAYNYVCEVAESCDDIVRGQEVYEKYKSCNAKMREAFNKSNSKSCGIMTD